MRYKYKKEEIEIAVLKSLSVAQVCRELNIRPIGGNYKTLRSKFKQWNIDISHFTGQGWNTGIRYRDFGKKTTLDEILVENSSYTSTSSLKRRLFKEGLKEHKCECCNLDTWLDNPIKLELHHENGINSDNRLKNLKILCPNCHAMTDNFRGSNMNKSYLSENRLERYNKRDEFKKIIKIEKVEKSIKVFKKCQICKNDIKGKGLKFCSYKCMHVQNAKNIPSCEDLIEIFKKLKSYIQVGKYYNVSDNAVKKWCIKYDIINKIKPPVVESIHVSPKHLCPKGIEMS